MTKKRRTRPGLAGTRIYEEDGWLKYFAPEPMLDKKTGRVKAWHTLCRVGPGDELTARNLLDAMLNKWNGCNSDFPPHFQRWRAIQMKKRAEKTPADPVKRKTWDDGTKAVDSQYNVIESAFRDTDIADIKPHHVNLFLEQWLGRRSAQTYRTYLERFFAYCCGQGLRETNPATSDLVVIEKPKKRQVTVSIEQFYAVRDALLTDAKGKKIEGGDMLQCYLDLNYLIGARNGDVRIIRCADVDEANKRIMVFPGKTSRTSGRAVYIPITEEIQAVLDRIKTIAKPGAEYLIHTRRGKPRPYTAHGIGSHFDRAMVRAKVEGFNSKDLRSMSLTGASLAGYSDEEIQVHAVHAELATTRGYIKKRNIPTSTVRMKMPERAKEKAGGE